MPKRGERGIFMINLTIAEAILKKYNKEAFHIQHAQTVSGVMGFFAKKHDPEREEYWRVVGMLHDTDFEEYPEEHCVKGIELLKSEGVPEDIIAAALSHGCKHTGSHRKIVFPAQQNDCRAIYRSSGGNA
jgi:predicted hydrolase (HD superfamily)